MKKILKIGGIIFGVIVVLLLILPFFINVEKFRPEIEKKMSESLNAKVKLGSLSLGLFPSLKIRAESLEITPKDQAFPESIIKCSDLKATVPLLALLGSPRATLEMVKPEINIIQRGGKYNFETLTEKKAVEEKPKATVTETSSGMMKKIESARLTLDVKDANLKFKNSTDSANIKVDELLLKNLGFNSPIEVKIVSDLNYKGETGELKGPFEFSGEIVSEKHGEEIGADFDLIGDFTKMLIKAGSSFHKPEKVPLKFSLKGNFKKGATTSMKVSDLAFELASFKMAGKLIATDLQGDAGVVDLDIQNKTSNLQDLSDLSPLLSDYKLEGKVSFFAKAKGPMKNPALDIELKADNLKGKTPKLSLPIQDLKVKLKVQGTLADPIVELDPADFLVGKSDMRLKLKAQGLKAPDVKIDLQSKSFDMTYLTSGKESAAGKSGAGDAPGKPLDAALDEMAPELEKSLKNPMLDKAHVVLSVSFGELKLQGAKLNNVHFLSNYASRNLKINDASFSGYGGGVQMSGSSQLNPAAPTYDYALKLTSIDLAKAIEAHAPAWKGQLSGILKGDMKIAGEGLRKAQTSKSLRGGIKGEITKGNTSLELSKIVSTVMKQLPQKPDLKGNASENKLKGKFKTLKMDSKIVGRNISFTLLDIIFEPDEYNMGEIQFKASGSLSFERNLDLVGDVFLSPQVVKWPEAVGKSGKIEIPLKIAGPMDSAKPDISYTLSKMGGRVLKKTAEKELKKGVENLLQGKKPGDFLKGLFK